MTSQQLADELLIHWRLLWPLSPSERIKRIDEIAEDLTFESSLQSVAEAMAEPECVA